MEIKAKESEVRETKEHKLYRVAYQDGKISGIQEGKELATEDLSRALKLSTRILNVIDLEFGVPRCE